MHSNISLEDLCSLFKIDFISLLQPSAAVIKSNEAKWLKQGSPSNSGVTYLVLSAGKEGAIVSNAYLFPIHITILI